MKPPKGEKLTAKQLAWIKHVLDNKSDAEAYRLAYGVPKKDAQANAWRLRADEGVVKELIRQRDITFAGKSMSRAEKEARLAEKIRSKETKDGDFVRCVNEHNRMTGDHEAVKVEVSQVGTLMEKLRNSVDGEH